MAGSKRLIGIAIAIGIATVGISAWDHAGSRSSPEADPRPVKAVAAVRFLDSIGVNLHVSQGYDPDSYIAPLRYTGIRETRDGARHVAGEIMLHRRTGVRFAIIGEGDLKTVLSSARALAKAGALLAIEGPNEPNNFPITYDGRRGGGRGGSWLPVAAFQRALYEAVRKDLILHEYPVFGPSETGAETSNVCLQFLKIPPGAHCPFPAGTRFADYANVHNYVSGNGRIYGPNQAWHAASPTLNARWDGLYGNYGDTWHRHYRGYSRQALASLPRVTTETGWDSESNPGGTAVQAAVLTDTYLAQFARGWSYTFVYEMRDGEGGAGHQGLYHGMTPKLAATYLHNMTSILADSGTIGNPGTVSFTIVHKTATVHSLLLEKSDGRFDLVIWDERVHGSDRVTVRFGRPQRSVRLFDIAVGTSPVERFANVRSVPLDLSNHAVILQLG